MKNSNNIKKILFINLIIIATLLILTESICFVFAYKFQRQYISSRKETVHYLLTRYIVEPTYQYYDCFGPKLRPVFGKNYKKRPVIMFGCSVTYGNKLKDSQTFSAKLSEYSKRPVYNRAFDGWSVQHMLKQLSDDNILKDIKNPEYIIYTYINDQRRRIYFNQGWPHDTEVYFRYKIDKNNNLVEAQRKFPFYWRFLTVKYFQYYTEKKQIENKQKSGEFFLRMLNESASLAHKKYPHAKLIMLLFEDDECSYNNPRPPKNDSDFLSTDEYSKIEKMGYKIYNIEKLAGHSYCTPDYKVDDHHPSEKMWNEFLPIFAKNANFN